MAEDALIDRQTLYDEVWAEPVTVVSKRYGLSDVGLAKLCRGMAIPLPGRGHWAKLKAGKTVHRIPLPPGKEAMQQHALLNKLKPAEQQARDLAKQRAAQVQDLVRSLAAAPEPTELHPLVRSTEKRLKRKDGWTGGKGLRSAPGEVLHLEVTLSSLDRSLVIMNILINELSRHDVTVQVDPSEKRTVFFAEGTRVQLAISEHVRRTSHEITPEEKKAQERYYKRSEWDARSSYPHTPMYDYHPTGVLTISAGRWPSRNWRDTDRTPLEKRFPEIVAGIITLAADIRAHEANQAREAEERRQAQARYEFLVKRRKDETENFEKLESDASNWERASRLRSYLDFVESKLRLTHSLTPELFEWISWARAKADWLDPSIAVSDPVLDAPEPKRPGYW